MRGWTGEMSVQMAGGQVKSGVIVVGEGVKGLGTREQGENLSLMTVREKIAPLASE